MKTPIGKRLWVIPEGYLPPDAPGKSRAMQSHEAACVLNAGETDAHLRLTLYFADRPPAGPYLVTVPAQRTLHLRFNDLHDPAPVPPGADYSSVIQSDVPVVVQHTRLDSRGDRLALMTTLAYGAD